MFPGSMLPPGVQLTANEYRRAPYDDEESFAQKYGRLVHRSQRQNPQRLALMGMPLALVVLLLMFHFIS